MSRSIALGRIALAAAVVALLPLSHADAQRGGGGGARGGSDAGFGGGRGALRQRPESGPEDMAQRFQRQFEDMAELKPVLKDIKLEKPAKDSINHLEKTYKERLRDYGKSAGKMLEAARAAGATPEPGAMGRLRTDARGMQEEEYGEVRKLLTEEQRATFEKNVADARAEEQKRMEERRGGGGGAQRP